MNTQTIAIVAAVVAVAAIGVAVYVAMKPPPVVEKPRTTAGTIIGGIVDAIL